MEAIPSVSYLLDTDRSPFLHLKGCKNTYLFGWSAKSEVINDILV